MTTKKKKPSLPKPPSREKPKPRILDRRPEDYLRGKGSGRVVGQDYTAYDTYNQGRPDFGKGAGPGEPYHEVQKKVQPSLPGKTSPIKNPRWAPGSGSISGRKTGTLPFGPQARSDDSRIAAIRRRLGNVK